MVISRLITKDVLLKVCALHIHLVPQLPQHDFYGLLLKQFLHVCVCVSLTAMMVPFVDIANRVSSSHHDVILSDAVSHCPYV